MKWRWRNDRCSERNLCNCVKKPEKKIRTSTAFEPVTSWFTGAMLYQLRYEATDVGSRSIMGSYLSVKEMSVNDKRNKSYMNCGKEMKMKKWLSQWTQFMQLRKEAWKKKKKFRTSTWPWSPEFFFRSVLNSAEYLGGFLSLKGYLLAWTGLSATCSSFSWFTSIL